MPQADLYERQIGGTVEQLSRQAFNDDKLYFQELDRILDELFEEAAERGLTWQDLAAQSGLHVRTIQNLGERWTKRPQFRTVLLIASALDRKINLYDVSSKAPSLRIAKAG